MCGIGGTVGDAPDTAVLAAMAHAMAHRGPDGERTWSDDRCGLAFRRLAILDLDERAMQPMHLGDLHLAFNGEIYNYRELRAELERAGHRFATTGDTEVLLHAWQAWGEGALERLNGMFALAVWDTARGSLTLAVDAFGEKPLYLARDGERLAFASDVRALRCARPDLGGPEEAAVGAFVALGVLPAAPRTCFAGIERIPPAHLLRWRGGRAELSRWWAPGRVTVPERPGEAAEALRELLLDAIALRLRSDVPVGTSLSGGLDSSAIVGLSAQLAGDHRRHAFTARFPGFERDEWPFAQLAAQAAEVEVHHAVEPTADELLDDLGALVRDQEEPFPTTSIYAQWRVMRAAREAGVTVLLDGQGADELFGGYVGVEPVAAAAAGPRAIGRALRRAPAQAPAIARALAAGRVPAVLARRERRRAASPYAATEVAAAAALADPPRGAVDARDGLLRRMLLQQTTTTSLPHLLRFADRDSMAHSREVRLPFLDRRVAEFALSAPPRLLVRGGERKALLRDAVGDVVPEPILDRRDKVGFETPEARWFAEPRMRDRLAGILLDGDGPAAALIDRRAVEADLADGRWRDAGALWRAANAQLWCAAFSPTAAPAPAIA
jgi:asparagine synthase (glutamine-hydrolysing)